ncbi:MAG: TAT-variant-translocated molybdopterin oxidoreductase, partial [Candidatus Methylomirabilales bacterium]
MKEEGLDLALIRSRLAGLRGQEYWRSLEELAETEAFQEFVHREFPQDASVWIDPIGRRAFLKLMGAALALAGLGACTRQPDEKIVPYVRAPEDIIPGQPLFFATALTLGGIATGVLVESHMGRPTKIEGNPKHPASLGATDAFAQASVLTLYDPDRSQVLTKAGAISTWDALLAVLNTELQAQRASQGAGLRVLTGTVTSPTLARQLRTLLTKFPSAKWHQYEPASRDHVRAGARLAFGQDIDTRYRFDRADVILALDADFLFCGPGALRYAREFVARRRVRAGPTATMNRLYAVESTPTLTGAMADHRLPLRAGQIEGFARAVARGLGVPGELAVDTAPSPAHAAWIAALVRDLQQHRGSSIVLAGDQQLPIVHALAHAMNHALGNVDKTVFYTDPVEAKPVDQITSLRELVRDMEAGRVEMLVIIGGNPVFTAPTDLDFAQYLSTVKLRIHLSLYDDETSALCHWHIPETHELESWSDARAFDGTVTITQPLIAPLYGGRSAHELLAVLTGLPGRSGYELVRDYWKNQIRSEDFEGVWRTALHDGLISGTAVPPKPVSLRPGFKGGSAARPGSPDPGGLEIVFRPDPTIWDGRFANNGWLQELPKPLTKLTWDNAALLSPATAERLRLANEEVVELLYRGRVVRAPVWIMPGHADDSVTVHLGYGRTRAGRVGTGAGFNAFALRTSDAPWFGSGLEIRKVGERYPLACTQDHHSMEVRNLVRGGTLAQFLEHPDFVHAMGHEPPTTLSMYPGFAYEGYA